MKSISGTKTFKNSFISNNETGYPTFSPGSIVRSYLTFLVTSPAHPHFSAKKNAKVDYCGYYAEEESNDSYEDCSKE